MCSCIPIPHVLLEAFACLLEQNVCVYYVVMTMYAQIWGHAKLRPPCLGQEMQNKKIDQEN